MELTFSSLQKKNQARCKQVFQVEDWSVTDWACAMAGEAGEACNIAKKMRRGDEGEWSELLAEELADVIIYADLLATKMNIDLGQAVVKKFNEVSLERLSDIYLQNTEQGEGYDPPKFKAGDFFRYDHAHGSVGVVKRAVDGWIHGVYYYGKDVKGQHIKACFYSLRFDRAVKITREEFLEMADSRFND